MTSLYGRLFHASSAHRERLEDYLTEVLGDLLNRISKEQVRAFCLEFLFDGIASELKAQWVMLFDRPGDVTWDTQESISVDGAEKRPDLILYQENYTGRHHDNNFTNGRRPLLVVECKIGAPFSPRQLNFYDQWLAQASGPSSALVVVTHLTEPPTDFQSGSDYRTEIRAVRKWSELYKWLRSDSGSWSSAAGAAVLVNELLEFMREENLMTEEITWQDVAAARMFLVGGAHARFRNFITLVRTAVTRKFTNLKGFPEKPPELHGDVENEVGAIQDWCNFHKDLWVYWGIYLGPNFWSPNIELTPERSDAGFVYIEFKQRVNRPPGNEFAAWHFPSQTEMDDFSVAKTLDLDHLETERITVGFSQWLIASLEEAKKIIEFADGEGSTSAPSGNASREGL